MVDCSNKNIHLFFKYVKGELNRKEECLIDRHIQSCEDCLFNFAYVEEIYTKKHLLSSDEKTTFIKYLSDPIWKNELEILSKDIKQKVKQEVKQEIINYLVTNHPQINNNFIDKVDNKPDSKTNLDKNNVIVTPKLKQSKQNIAHKTYSVFFSKNQYLAAVASIVIFTGLSTSIYLMINKVSNQSQPLSIITPSFSPTPINSDSKSFIDTIYSKTINNTSSTNNLYEELDLAINGYLENKDISYLNKAKQIAMQINNKYSDKYGVDLVKYYELAPLDSFDRLSLSRKNMLELLDQPPGDNYKKALEQSLKLEKIFFQLNNKIEFYRTKTITNKLHTMLYNYQSSESITKEGLGFSIDNQYLFLQGYFLLWEAKKLSETSSFEKSEELFQQTIHIGKKINLEDLVTTAKISLSTLYHLNNDDLKCLETVESLLASAKNMKKTRIVALMQIAGLAATNLKYNDLSDQYLKASLELAEEIKKPAYIARSSMFLSLALAERKDFSASEKYYLKSINAISNIEDEKTKSQSLYLALGYYGKAKLLEGDFLQASETYKQALDIMKKLNINNSLQLSQINQGLALASKELKNNEEAKQYFIKATYYANLANESKQKDNCLLSFIPSPCYLK
ncbi:MAG: tetratricopeptide repeat protein [Acidobacteria bacterium]|nr:tetratricopeptide repeat protein [Acidobacteriota bacterium]